MKVEDLMIGDLVHSISTIHNVSFPDNGVIQDEGYTTIRTPIKITTVSENCVSYYSNKLELYITLSSEEIEPIPLTPEILEKNGFEDTIRDAIWISTNCNLLWKDGKLKNFCREEDDEVCIPCEYVHELQHTLKLCEIDKEIVI
jgi:hypothetical protein